MKWFLPGLLAISGFAADLVNDVGNAAAAGDFVRAGTLLQRYESQRGQTPESILARSWMARIALDQKKYDQAGRYAQETYDRATKELSKRALDKEPNLPLALGAAIEVQAQVLAAKDRRAEAISMLQSQLLKYSATSIRPRIQKNINLLTMEGKPAPPLQGVVMPKGKPALIFFWAHWCGDCFTEAPSLVRLKQEFGPKGLVFIGPTQKYGYIGAEQNVPAAREVAYIEQTRKQLLAAIIDGPPIINEQNFMRYGVSTVPTLTLVDKNGIVRLYHPGAMMYQELRAAIENLLAR